MDKPFGFDPQLPDLALAFDRDAVARLFERQWPGRDDGGPPRITKVKSQDIKYQPGVRCVTTYELLAERDGAPPQRTLGVVEIRPDGVAHRLYDDDPRLPWLADAVDAVAMHQRFAALLPNTVVEGCTVAPVRYRAGVRCVFRYDVQTSAGREVSFGKLLGEGGEQLLATVSRLHAASGVQVNAPDGAPQMPRILRPLAYWPDIHMLIQAEVVGGAELNDLAFDPAQDAALRERWLREAGRAWRACTRRRCQGRRAPWPTIWPSWASMSRPWRSPTGRWHSATSRRWRGWPSVWTTRPRRAAPRTAPSAPTSL